MSDYNTDAPLATTDFNGMEGLTLDDLQRLHGSDAPPATLEASPTEPEPTESELAFELQEHAGQEAPVDRRLRQTLVMSLDGEEIHLDQKDDLRGITAQAVQLFQDTLPQAMQHLGQYLHASEQIEHLYDRLAELSNSRGAAADIIQTAKQIEHFEKQLQQEQLDVAQFSHLDSGLAQFEAVIQRYREVCALAARLG